LLENQVDLKRTFQHQHGRRAGNLAFVTVWEMLMAMVRRFEQIALAPDTIWVFPEKGEKVDISSILDWLFRR
jgi:hypothetical protein